MPLYEIAKLRGYVHFMNLVSEEEMIVISRPKRGGLVYFTSFSYLCLALSGIMSLFSRSRSKKKVFKSNYFKTRINTILLISSTLILDDMRLYMFSSFLLYTKRMLITVMLARMSVEEIRRMVLILVLK